MKGFLSQRGISFQEIDVSRDAAAAQQLVRKTGQMAVPVTEIDGNLVVGFNQQQLEYHLSRAARTSAPQFGASVTDAELYTSRHGLKTEKGVYIGSVRAGLPAASAGLKTGDIITGFNSTTINNTADMNKVLKNLQKGARIKIKFLRAGESHQAEGLL